jgi:uncharacterized protein YcbX
MLLLGRFPRTAALPSEGAGEAPSTGYLAPSVIEINDGTGSIGADPGMAIRKPICGNSELAAEEPFGQFSSVAGRSKGSAVNNAMAIAKIQAIYRYPVKGLSPEPLARAPLAVGATLAADRLYAIENGPAGFDPAAPRYLPKQRFLMLMRNERLARLRTRYEEPSHTLVVELEGREVARGDLWAADGRRAIERFFAGFCADELRGEPKLLHARGFSFSDVAAKVVSIINLASVAAVEASVGAPVHPLRFRGNVYVAGWPAWREFDLVGGEVAMGTSARLRIVKRTTRCAATEVDPDTGMRDLAVPQALLRNFGHTDCGVYGEVVEAGEIGVGDQVV